MKLDEVIKKDSKIVENQTQFFIADKDFLYEGLPILKNALVYNNGRGLIEVNLMRLGILQDRNVPDIIKSKLPEDDKYGDKLVDKVSSCNSEINVLDLVEYGIWHNDHFDEWKNSFADYLERINEIPILKYSGISFSSLMYKFNAKSKTLDYFINPEPITIDVNGKQVNLPKLLEINQNTIIPIKGMEYFGVQLKGYLNLSENAIISGSCAQDFEVEISINGNNQIIIISKGTNIEISNTGEIKIELFNEKTHKIEKHKAVKRN